MRKLSRLVRKLFFLQVAQQILTTLITNDYYIYQTEERSTIDNIFCIPQKNGKVMTIVKEVRRMFIVLSKTYDTVPIKKLFEDLDKSLINITLVKAIKELYKKANSIIQIGNTLRTEFDINKGLQQDCSFSFILFNIYFDTALNYWRRICKQMRILIDGRTLYNYITQTTK